jgi:hypothetical protein
MNVQQRTGGVGIGKRCVAGQSASYKKARCQMKKVYESAAMFFRWAVISVIALIVALPTLVSIDSYI